MSPESGYILDCAVEFGEITPMEAAIYGARTAAAEAFEALLEADCRLPDHWLRNTARAYLAECSEPERYVWALYGLNGIEYALQMFEDRVEFLLQRKVQTDLGVCRRTPLGFIAESHTMDEGPAFTSVHDVNPDRVRLFANTLFGEPYRRLHEDLALAQEAMAWLAEPGNAVLAQSILRRLFNPGVAPAGAPTVRQLVQRARPCVAATSLPKPAQRKARSAIKKVLRLFDRTGQSETVRMLVTGNDVTLAHPESPFKFVLKPTSKGWLEARTYQPGFSAPFQLMLLTKEDVFLSRLCVYFDGTPVLDQLLALTLFVQAGDELEILKKANWFGFEDLATVKRVIQAEAPVLLERLPKAESRARGGVRDPHLDELDREAIHWAPFKGPVKTWLAEWLAPLTQGFAQLAQLQDPPQPLLQAA